jgi:hypothetical protein
MRVARRRGRHGVGGRPEALVGATLRSVPRGDGGICPWSVVTTTLLTWIVDR